jgi:fluoroquinolone transport system ATP-binding protein
MKNKQTRIFSVENVYFSYQSAKKDVKPTLNNLSFEVRSGEIYGFLGPSGAGKSTTQKILTRIIKDYKGSIKYKGKDLKSFNRKFYEDIGIGFELPVHFSKLSARENLRFFQSLYKNKIDFEPILKRLNLADDADRPVGDYSKGMKMRLNFARALINNPKFLFLDEPTNGLDPSNAKIIKDMILEFKKKGGTVFLTTHLMADVEALCDYVVFLNDGKIVESDTVKNLKIKHGKKSVKVEYLVKGKVKSAEFEINKVGSNKAFLALIKKYPIQTIHSQETSLEDIFIKVTGVKKYEKLA